MIVFRRNAVATYSRISLNLILMILTFVKSHRRFFLHSFPSAIYNNLTGFASYILFLLKRFVSNVLECLSRKFFFFSCMMPSIGLSLSVKVTDSLLLPSAKTKLIRLYPTKQKPNQRWYVISAKTTQFHMKPEAVKQIIKQCRYSDRVKKGKLLKRSMWIDLKVEG